MKQTITKKEVVNYCGLMWIAGANVSLFGALLPYLYQENLLNFVQAGQIRSITTLALAVSTLMAGWLLERFKMPVTYLCGFLLMLLGCAASIVANTPGVLCVMLLLLGFGNSLMQNTFNIDLNNRVNSNLHVVNRVNAFFSAAGIATPLLLSSTISVFGSWKGYIWLIGIWIVLFGVLTMRRDMEVSRLTSKEEYHPSASEAKNQRSGYVLVTLMFSLSSLFQGVFSGWFTSFLTQGELCTLQVAQAALSCFWVGNMLARFFWPSLFQKVHHNVVMLGAALLGVVSSGAIMLLHGYVMMPIAFVVGFCNGGYYPTLIADLGRYINDKAILFCAHIMTMGSEYLTGLLFENQGVFVGFLIIPASSGILAGLAFLKMKQEKNTGRTKKAEGT